MNWITYTKDTPPPDWSIVAIRSYLEGWKNEDKLLEDCLYYFEGNRCWIHRDNSDDMIEVFEWFNNERLMWDYLVLDQEVSE